MRTANSGFTLIEILMAVGLVAIVSVVAIPQFLDFRVDAKIAVTQEKLAGLREAIVGDARRGRTGYFTHMGVWPGALSDLTTKGSKPDYNPITKLGWNGPYVDSTQPKWEQDAWDSPLVYEAANRLIRSCGPNLTCGDGDDLTVRF